jgi:hypothetical protein
MAEEGRPEPSATTGAVEPVVAHVEEEAPAEAGLVDIASILGASTVTVVRSSLYVKSIFEYYVLVILLWLITKFVLSRKSTDLSWEGEEPSATAGEEDPSPALEESATLPQAETIAQGTKAMLPKATVVEGT